MFCGQLKFPKSRCAIMRHRSMEGDMQEYEIVRDKVRIRDEATRQWLVYINGRLRAECTSRQSAEDFVAIERNASRG